MVNEKTALPHRPGSRLTRSDLWCRWTRRRAAAPLGDLKARMGHDSARAAMIYQHATAAADRAIADALDRQIETSKEGGEDRPGDDDDGLGGVLVPAG